MLPFRRQRSLQRRIVDALTRSSKRKPALRTAAAALDRTAAAALDRTWARSWPAGVARESFMNFVLNPLMDMYARRRATGREKLSSLKGPVILVANHASHLDTPVILSALPRSLRKRTAVAAAADYFYRNRVVASLVSLVFNTVPIERKGSGGGVPKNGSSHLDKLLDQGWNLLLYPEGTRSRAGVPGRVRRGAAVLASAHHLVIVPIRVTGTAAVMPPGRMWPKRLRGKLISSRHRIEVSFGEPIPPSDDTAELIERVQTFFENGDGRPSTSPYRRARKSGNRSD